MSAAFRATFRATLQDRLEGLCLLCLGGFLAGLASSRHYWSFLNPKFSPLTLGAGVLLSVCGLALVLRPEPGRATAARLTRQALVLAFLCLAAFAWRQAAAPPLPGALTLRAPVPDEPEAPPPLRVTVDNVEYVRLNLAELFIMPDKRRTDYPRHFAMRVQVGRTPELDSRGHVLLKRIAVTCCLADSLELAFLASGIPKVQDRDVQGEVQAGEVRSEEIRSGDWLEVYGRLEPLKPKGADRPLLAAVPKGRGMSIFVLNPGFRVVVEKAERITLNDVPFLFEFREKEPFAW